MSWLRVKLGCWLLGPLIRAEFHRTVALEVEDARAEKGNAIYWRGRRTAVERLWRGLCTREDHVHPDAGSGPARRGLFR